MFFKPGEKVIYKVVSQLHTGILRKVKNRVHPTEPIRTGKVRLLLGELAFLFFPSMPAEEDTSVLVLRVFVIIIGGR